MSKKRVTMQHIAEQAGVSRTTVSFVLNNTPGKNISQVTRDNVWRVARTLGYQQAQQQVSTIGFVIRGSAERIAQSAFMIEALQGVSSVVEPNDFFVSLIAPDKETNTLNLGNIQRLRGLVFSDALLEDEELHQLVQSGIPLVTIGTVNRPDVYSVDIDNTFAAFVAVRHLLELGHQRIAMIAHTTVQHKICVDRIAGYKNALADFNIAYDVSLLRYASFTSESGHQAMTDILVKSEQRPTAVFMAGDVVALGAIAAIQEAGLRIPEDVSVVGFDDIPLARYLSPPLTTIRRRPYQVGERAAEVLLSLIAGDNTVPRQTLLNSELVVRGSTAPYPPHNGHYP